MTRNSSQETAPQSCYRNTNFRDALQIAQIRIKKLCREAICPSRGTQSAAGYDLASCEFCEVPAHGRALIHTGIGVEIPDGFHIEIRPRSGLALRHGITVLNTPGTIDSDYRGELMIILFNTTDENFSVHPGDRIAQAVVMRHSDAEWIETEAFSESDRGEKGFGSTGISFGSNSKQG